MHPKWGPMIKTSRQKELVARMADLGPVFEQRAFEYDKNAAFPYENFVRGVGWRDLAEPRLIAATDCKCCLIEGSGRSAARCPA